MSPSKVDTSIDFSLTSGLQLTQLKFSFSPHYNHMNHDKNNYIDTHMREENISLYVQFTANVYFLKSISTQNAKKKIV